IDEHNILTFKINSLREAAGHNNIAESQGYQRCHCKTKCQDNRCACRADKKLCNSKCHSTIVVYHVKINKIYLYNNNTWFCRFKLYFNQ
ncbi:KRAB-A domain-containing protein 2, partial [Aphis craccivora]